MTIKFLKENEIELYAKRMQIYAIIVKEKLKVLKLVTIYLRY